MSTAPRQHTPGPWELDYDKGSTQDILSRKHGGICTVRRAGRHDNTTFAANARLIASAPDLLAALEVLIADAAGPFSDSHSPYFSVTPSTLANARAAIARATTGGNAS